MTETSSAGLKRAGFAAVIGAPNAGKSTLVNRLVGAKVSIVVAPSIRGRLPIVRDAVTTITTPGETVGVIVTERGIAVNDNLPELKAELIRRHAPVKDIHQLRDEIYAVTGVPKPIEFEDKVVALIEYRDGSIIDVVRQVRA